MKLLLIAFGSLFILNATAMAAVVENIHVPKEVQQHVNFITFNCEVTTHLTERIKEDELFGGQIVPDPMRNLMRVIRSCDNGTFAYSREVVDTYHDWLSNEIKNGEMIPVFTRLRHQADYFVRTGRYYFSAK